MTLPTNYADMLKAMCGPGKPSPKADGPHYNRPLTDDESEEAHEITSRKRIRRSRRWFNEREGRIREVRALINSLSVWEISEWPPQGTNDRFKNKADIYHYRCGPMDEHYFYDVIVPEVRKFVEKKWPGSQIRRESNHYDTDKFCGELLVAWQPDYLHDPGDIETFWKDFY